MKQKTRSSSSLGSASTGGEFTKMLHYYPEVSDNREPIKMTITDLRTESNMLVNTTVKIEHVFYYINPLLSWQIEDRIMHHAFIVFRTSDGYWWSIEKNTKGIILQRSIIESFVRDVFENSVRISADITILGIQLKKEGPGASDATLKKIVHYILINNCLNYYHFLSNNCIHFGKGCYICLIVFGLKLPFTKIHKN